MFFGSDNTGPAHPKVMEAVVQANAGYTSAYGDEAAMDVLRATIREIFEAPEAAVYLVATGTAANSLALATLTNPWDTIFCARVAHVQEDECNAPEFFTGGAKLTLVGDEDKMTPDALRAAIEKEETRGVHGPQRGAVTITQATERGRVYGLDELRAVCAVAKGYDVPVHLDGARFSNAMVSLGCSAADMTWKAGVDAVSFGGTKNGCLGVEAVIFFDPAKAWEFELRRKRGAHLFSKHRYLSAQMQGYLTDGVWTQCAACANANAAHLAKGMKGVSGVDLMHDPQANMIFANMPRGLHQRLLGAGAVYSIWDGELDGADLNAPLLARFVCDWSLGTDQIDQFLTLLRQG